MMALLQRVSSARVTVDGRVAGEIGHGLLILFCAVKGDTEKDLDYVAKKASQLRIFADDQGRMNRSVLEGGGSVLVVSQFTLAASTRKGNRPSFDAAEEPGRAKQLCDAFCARLRETGLFVAEGVFGAAMSVTLTNDGPVTVMIDSRGHGPQCHGEPVEP